MLAGALLQDRPHRRFIISVFLQLFHQRGRDAFPCAKSRHLSSLSSPSTFNKQAGSFWTRSSNSKDSLHEAGALFCRPTTELECAIQTILSRRNLNEPIEVSVAKAKFPSTAPNLAVLLSRLTWERARDGLRIVLFFMKRHPSYSPENHILDALNRLWHHERQRFPTFMATFLEMRKGQSILSLKQLMHLIRLFAWAGMVEDVLAFLRQYKKVHRIQAEYQHFSFALHTCVQEKRLDVSLEVFQEMDQDGQMPTYESFQTLIAGLLPTYRIEEAGSLLLLMIARGILPRTELPSKSISYLTVIATFLHLGDLEHAHLFLLNLADVGYRPDYFTCTMILNEFSRKGQVQAFIQLYEEMKARDLLPAPSLFKRFVRDRCGTNLNHESLQMLNAMACTLDSITYFFDDNLCVSPSSQQEKTHLTAGRSFTQSDDEGSEDSYFMIFDQLIHSFSMLERPHDAYEMLLSMLECSKGAKFPAAATSMLLFDALIQRCELEKSEHLLRLMLKRGHMPTVKLLDKWVQGLCNAGKVGMAYRFLDQCNVEELILDATSYTMMIDALCSEGRLHEAKKITNELRWNVGIADLVIYSKMIQSFAKAGDIESPLKLLEKMIDMGMTPFALPFTPLINNLCALNKTNEALALLDEIESKGCRPLPSLYTLVVRACHQFKDMEGAFKVMDVMKSKGVTPEPEAHKLLLKGCMASQRSSSGIAETCFSH